MSRRKRKPVKYKRLIESDSDDDAFAPSSKKGVQQTDKRAKRLSPNNKFECDRQLHVDSKISFDTSLVIGNSLTNDIEDSLTDETINSLTDGDTLSTLLPPHTCSLQEGNPVDKENKSTRLLSWQLFEKDNVHPIKSLWIPPGPAKETIVLPRPSYTSMRPAIRLGLSRKATINKTLHMNTVIKK